MTTAHVIGFLVGLTCGLVIGAIVVAGLMKGVRSAIREHTAKCKAMVDAQKAGLTEDNMRRLARISGEAHTAMAAGRQMAIAKSHTNTEP